MMVYINSRLFIQVVYLRVTTQGGCLTVFSIRDDSPLDMGYLATEQVTSHAKLGLQQHSYTPGYKSSKHAAEG